MKIKTNVTTKPEGFKLCNDISGIKQRHGDYFTPTNSACNRCKCNDGQAENCVVLQCQKPTCKNYEQVPGTCCEYRCPREFVLTDKSTAAVVASLSIILVVILVAISLVWRKMKKKEKYGKRFETLSTNSSQQETDLDLLIQKNSIPNNRRQANQSLKSKPEKEDETNEKLFTDVNNKHGSNNNSSTLNPNSQTNLFVSSKGTGVVQQHNNIVVNGDGPSIASSSSSLIRMKPLSGQQQQQCCSSTNIIRRFEPPPPYTPTKADTAFV